MVELPHTEIFTEELRRKLTRIHPPAQEVGSEVGWVQEDVSFYWTWKSRHLKIPQHNDYRQDKLFSSSVHKASLLEKQWLVLIPKC